MLDKKQFRAIFLFDFKISGKAAETTCNINNSFDPGTANKRTVCSGGSRSFAKETRGLKVRSVVAGHLKLTTIIWERPSKLVLLQLHKLRKDSTSTILWSFGIWSKLERWKSLVSGCLTSWPEITLFWSAVFSYSMQQQWSISWSDCDMQQKVDFIQLAMPNLVWWDQAAAPKHFPKQNVHQKKVMVTVWWSAAHLIHYSFLNPSKAIITEKYAQQINEMH